LSLPEPPHREAERGEHRSTASGGRLKPAPHVLRSTLGAELARRVA
jgi:hypothetical protein